MNNKGFAITTILYGILILFMMLLVSMLGMLSTYKDRLSILIENTNGTRDIINGEIRCSIEYDLNGGTGEISSQSDLCGSEITITNTKPIRDGYLFLGWNKVKDATTEQYKANQKINIYEDHLLYAIYIKTNIPNSYKCANGSVGYAPYSITYTGNCEVIDDGSGNWRIKLLTSGIFISKIDLKIDTFLVGGGGGGASGVSGWGGGGGGGGGYVVNSYASVVNNTEYEIIIGDGGNSGKKGGNTTAFNQTAEGGNAGSGMSGGSGGGGGGGGVYGNFGNNHVAGKGGSNGSSGNPGKNGNGTATYGKGGAGRGISTYEFGDSSLTLYAGGGGGAAGLGCNDENCISGSCGSGGSGGGGAGGKDTTTGTAGTANTGGGGGGGGGGNPLKAGGKGGSGIVVIRNTKSTCSSKYVPNDAFDFTYTGNCEVIDDGNGDWRIKFLTSGTFTVDTQLEVDTFLVGGGGGGAPISGSAGGGGGGGGYVTNSTANIIKDNEYQIVIGSGGTANNKGGETSGFGQRANGGNPGSGLNGGAGGSGGGGACYGNWTNNHVAGSGGSNGRNGGAGKSGNGLSTYSTGGTGGGVTTYEFGDSTLTLYAGGGGGGSGVDSSEGAFIGSPGSGGSGGGAAGGAYTVGSSAKNNTGGGGGGGGGYGGSGVLVIRNKRYKK